MQDSPLNYMLQLFANRDDAYYVQIPDANRYTAVYQPLTINQIRKHIEGIETLALPAVCTKGLAKWLAFDSDHNNGQLQRVEDFLKSEGWHVLRESKREGREGHLWLLLDRPVVADMLRRFGQEIAKRVGVSLLDIEMVPKQSKPGKLASSLRLPLGINMKQGVYQRGWFSAVEQDVVTQLEWLADQPRNSARRVERIATQLKIEDARRIRKVFQPIGLINRQRTYEKTNLLDVIPHAQLKRLGNEWITQCPVCASEGHDSHKDNLHIDATDGTVFCCWYGNNPGKIHTTRTILAALAR